MLSYIFQYKCYFSETSSEASDRDGESMKEDGADEVQAQNDVYKDQNKSVNGSETESHKEIVAAADTTAGTEKPDPAESVTPPATAEDGKEAKI